MYVFPLIVDTDFEGEEDISEVIEFFEVAFGVGQKVPELCKHADTDFDVMPELRDLVFSVGFGVVFVVNKQLLNFLFQVV